MPGCALITRIPDLLFILALVIVLATVLTRLLRRDQPEISARPAD